MSFHAARTTLTDSPFTPWSQPVLAKGYYHVIENAIGSPRLNMHPVPSPSCAPQSQRGNDGRRPIPRLPRELWWHVAHFLDGKDERKENLNNLRLAIGRKLLPAAVLPRYCDAIASHHARQSCLPSTTQKARLEALALSLDVADYICAARKLCTVPTSEDFFFSAQPLSRADAAVANLIAVVNQARNLRRLHLDQFVFCSPLEACSFVNAMGLSAAAKKAFHQLLHDKLFSVAYHRSDLTSLTLSGLDELRSGALLHLSGMSLLEELSIYDCRELTCVPDQVWRLPSLTRVDFRETAIKKISLGIKHAEKLKSFTLVQAWDFANQLPDELFSLKNLQELTLIDVTKALCRPINIGNFVGLRHLTLQKMRLEALPDNFRRMANSLITLDLFENHHLSLPTHILASHSLQRVRLGFPGHLARSTRRFNHGLTIKLSINFTVIIALPAKSSYATRASPTASVQHVMMTRSRHFAAAVDGPRTHQIHVPLQALLRSFRGPRRQTWPLYR